MGDLGRALVLGGLAMVLVGAVILLASRLGVPRLPGDIVIRRGGFTFAFPLATSLLLSLILTILLNLLLRRR